jgi:hypothetical protein
VVLLAVWSVLATGAHSATLRAYSEGTTNEAVQLRGLIGPGDASRLRDLVSAAAQAGRPVPSLSLDSLGGTFGPSAELADVVKTFGLTTYVEDGAVCASACFLVFAAGKQKFATYGGRIGVHAAKDPAGDASRAAAGTEMLRRVLAVLGVPPSITKKMAETPNEKMVWLSVPELRSMGVTLLGVSEPSPFELALPTLANPAPETTLSEPEAAQLWNRYVRAASRLSARQHGGRAQIQNACTRETCTNSVTYTGRDQSTTALRTIRDRSRRILRRDVCDVTAAAEPRCRAWPDPAQVGSGSDGPSLTSNPLSRDALWLTVRSCIFIKQTLGLNGACTQISAAYAVLRIPGSRTHTLVVPTSPVEGIESPLVRSALGQELWHAALDARKLVLEAVDGRIPIEAVGLAINSANSRTQDQLHIHVDCVQPEVRAALRERASDRG